VILVIGVIVEREVQVLVGTEEREPGHQEDHGQPGPTPGHAFNEMAMLRSHTLQTQHTIEAAANELFRPLRRPPKSLRFSETVARCGFRACLSGCWGTFSPDKSAWKGTLNLGERKHESRNSKSETNSKVPNAEHSKRTPARLFAPFGFRVSLWVPGEQGQGPAATRNAT